MRTERNRDGTWNVWMSRDEYRELPRSASSLKSEVAIRLMGDTGLRSFEVPEVTPGDISRMKDGRHYELEVTSGKDTTGEYAHGKQRETWLPIDTEALINRHVQNADLGPDDPLVDVSRRQVQNYVTDAAAAAAEETGDRDYQRLSSHDLRRCWAQYLLVEKKISSRIVMDLGGWSSYDAIEPYLAAPTEDNIIDSMSGVGL